MSDEEDVESQSLDTMPLSNGFSICDYDDIDDTDLAPAIDAGRTASPKLLSDMNGRQQGTPSHEDLEKIQDLVTEMKQDFSQALNELSKIQYSDKALEEKLNEHKANNKKQLADIVQMILSLKTELSTPLGQIRVALEEHKVLKRQVEKLQQENVILIEELERRGTIADGLRRRCFNHDSPVSRSTSLPESALLSPSHGRSLSDRDSGVTTNQNDSISTYGERSPPEVAQITPMVHNYIDNLHSSGVEPLDDLSDDSDSNSVTAVANKSIDLSRSLVDKCLVGSDDDDDDDGGCGDDVERRSKTLHLSASTLNTNNAAHHNASTQHNKHTSYDLENQLDRRKSLPSPTFVLASPFSRKMAPHELAYRDKQRSRVAHELVETERKYCSCLWTMVDFLMESLKQAAVINNRDVKLIFPVSLNSMYEFHADILKRFEERINNWKLHAIVGDIFARITDPNSEFLLLYRMYVNDFQTALQTIRKCSKQSHKFRKLLMTLQIHPCCDGLDLSAFLLTPIQRIPRYVLLIKQMLSFTEADHPDHYYLETTLEKLKLFLDQLNSSIETGVPMHQYSYVPDSRSRPTSSRRYSSSYEAAESETGSDLINQSLDGDSSIISMSSRNVTISRSKLQQVQQPRSTTPTDSVVKPIPKAKLFQQQQGQCPNLTLPSRRRRQRGQMTGRPKSLYDQMDNESLEYDTHVDALTGGVATGSHDLQRYDQTKRSKSQSNLLESTARQAESLMSRSLIESEPIEKLTVSKANHRSMPSVAQVDEELLAPSNNGWRDADTLDRLKPKVNNSNLVLSEGPRKKKNGFIRESIKSIFSRKRSSKNYEFAGPRFSVPDETTLTLSSDDPPRFAPEDEALMTSLLEDDGTPCSAV